MQNTDTTKYIIHSKINADGIIERPDIVGAIFGQTEGLLGSDLDLRDLFYCITRAALAMTD